MDASGAKVERMAGYGGMRRRQEMVLEGFGLEASEVPSPATSVSLFANDASLELEVGSGKGTFLVSESRIRPGVNFLGIEYQRRYWRYAADRLRRNGCSNVRVVLADASTFIRDFIADASLSAVHIYFPDPWPKKRHHKRRFVQPDRVGLLAKKMISGARLQIVTDHAGYFEQIETVLQGSSLVTVPFGAPAAAEEEEIVGSNFERKYRTEGRSFHSIAAEKV